MDAALKKKLDQLLEEEKAKRMTPNSKKSSATTSHQKSKGTGYGGTESASIELSSEIRSQVFESQSKADSELQNAVESLRREIASEIYISAGSLLSDLQESIGLRWALKYLLVNDSLLDIGNRAGLYRTLLKLVKTLSNEPFAAPYLTYSPASEEASACDLLKVLSQQSKTFLQLYQNNERDESGGSEVEVLSTALMMALDITETYSSVTKGLKDSNKLGITILQSSSAIKPAASASASATPVTDKKRKRGNASSSSAPSDTAADTNQMERDYLAALRPLKFEAIALCEMVMRGETKHRFLGANASNYLQTSSGHGGVVGDARKRLSRVACEMSGLSSSLPVELGSSIFVRCDESRMDVLKALIVGPEGTPYANGLFEFDILLPPAYPEVPPLVNLVTTGGGTVGFNPNLYSCGKVCLSLLGTWEGPSWNPKEPTLLQVLVSIQSLILVPDPYFNEPGVEEAVMINNSAYANEIKRFDSDIRLNTTRFAIMEQMQKPSPVFKDVIQLHFYHKRDAIAAQLSDWRGAHFEDPRHQRLTVHQQLTLSAKGKKGKKSADTNANKPDSPYIKLTSDFETAVAKLVVDVESSDGNKKQCSDSTPNRSQHSSKTHNTSSSTKYSSSSSSIVAKKGEVISLLDDSEGEDPDSRTIKYTNDSNKKSDDSAIECIDLL